MMATLTAVMYLTVVLIFTSLIISHVENLFMAICMSLLGKCLLPVFQLGCLGFFVAVELYELFVYFVN